MTARELAPGQTFAGYVIEEMIGRGGMAAVYRATQPRPRRSVALKVVAPQLAGDPHLRARFERESEVAAQIEHPNVVPVYDVGEEGGQLYIAMRFVPGTDLRALLREPLEIDRALALLAQIAAALDAAHTRGLIHRDVKPANILVASGGDEHVYLSDFGLAVLAGASDRLTRTGQWVGTVDYIAPEQIEGKQAGPQADVYALGCVLHEALAGQVPFPRDSHVAKMWAHLYDLPEDLAALRADVPPALAAAVRRAMAKDPGERQESAGELLREAKAAAGEGRAAPRPGTDVPTRALGAGPGSSGTRPRRRPPRWTAVAAGLLTAAAAAVALLLIPAGEGGEDGPAVGEPIAVGRWPAALAADDEHVWVANVRDGTVSRIDPRAGTPVGEPLAVGRQPYGIALAGETAWVALLEQDAVVRLDRRSGKRIGRPIDVGRGPADLAVGAGSVWVACYRDNTVTRIDVETGRVRGAAIRVGRGPTDVAFGEGGVWVTNAEDDTLTRINPATGRVVGAAIPVGESPESVAVGAGAVWVANIRADTVTVVDPRSGQVSGPPIPVGERPDDVAVAYGSVWVANRDGNSVTRIDPQARAVAGAAIPSGDGPAALAPGAGALWVANYDAQSVVPLRP